jgi:putative methionine-R-sulfoxide reductase with GAF domain
MERNSEIEISLNFCMDYYSILDNRASQAGPETAPPNLAPANLETAGLVSPDLALPRVELKQAVSVPRVREALRFPGEDGGKSLSEMAQRDLDATLQLLAERAQYITGASGAAIALRQGETMVCCASSGGSAPELGAHLQIDSGLSAESVKTRQILHCDDAENDPRVNRESCKAFGIASVVVMPLVRGEEVYGVFELLSGRPRAFEERDFVALNRLAEMIQTAVEHADAARRAEAELAKPETATAVVTETVPAELANEPQSVVVEADSAKPVTSLDEGPMTEAPAEIHSIESGEVVPAPLASPAPNEISELEADAHEAENTSPNTTIAFGNLRKCETCGFPVSEGRRLCLDCEAATPDAVASASDSPEFFGEMSESNANWVRSHLYLIATAVVAVATIVLLVWRS